MMAAMSRIMGVDVGSVRVGVALSDEGELIARPLDTVSRKSDRSMLADLRRLARENEVGRIVVGLPLSMDGGEQESTADARAVAERLRKQTRLPVVVWDERLTTVQAERALREGGVKGRRSRQVIDRVAAAVMLQSYLDSRSSPAAGGDR